MSFYDGRKCLFQMYLQWAVVTTSEPPVQSVAPMRSGAMVTVCGLRTAAAGGRSGRVTVTISTEQSKATTAAFHCFRLRWNRWRQFSGPKKLWKLWWWLVKSRWTNRFKPFGKLHFFLLFDKPRVYHNLYLYNNIQYSYHNLHDGDTHNYNNNYRVIQ